MPAQTHPLRTPALVAASSVLPVLVACVGLPPSPQAVHAPPARLGPAVGAHLQRCEALVAGFQFEHTRLTRAQPQPAAQVAGQALPAHCLVQGRMHERRGRDGQDYAIGFEMRLPQAWNGRFYYQGNGGLDGVVAPAYGALGGGPTTGALAQGFAVISADAGHTAAQIPAFGRDPDARTDYAYRAVARLTPMAKALIQSAYGKGPDRSYIGGCSNGGRHALVTSARLGEAYDGYLVGAPGHRVPLAALANMQGAQLWAGLLPPGSATPDLAQAFTDTQRQTVARAILDRCDALDGARDGLVLATQACQAQFDPLRDVPRCTPTRSAACVPEAQLQVLATVYAGVRGPQGERLYSRYPYDPGLVGKDWASWKFGRALSLNPQSVGTVFSVPPGPLDPLRDDLAPWLLRLHATNAEFATSGLEMMGMPSHASTRGLQPLRARGAKMMIYHGVSDPIFSADDTRQWVDDLAAWHPGGAADFVRYFPVPGMNHCSGGPATDHTDLLTPLVAWVEHGQAPDALPAQVRGPAHPAGANPERPADGSPTRSRPLCAHPGVAVYRGSGSLEDAASFACQGGPPPGG